MCRSLGEATRLSPAKVQPPASSVRLLDPGSPPLQPASSDAQLGTVIRITKTAREGMASRHKSHSRRLSAAGSTAYVVEDMHQGMSILGCRAASCLAAWTH